VRANDSEWAWVSMSCPTEAGANGTRIVRVGDPSFVITVTLGVLVWFGLYLRDERLRALIPLRNRRA
jgi:hypothetical protein